MILQPPSTLIVGASGSGKSSAIATKLLCGLKVFVIVTEPGGIESILDSCERIGAKVDNLHWATCLPAAAGFSGFEDMILKINSFDQKQLSDIKDMGKRDFRDAAMRFLNTLKRFHCERTNLDFEEFTRWDDTCSLDIDSLTGWSNIAWGCTVGYKPTANPGEWGIAQNFINNMLLKINTDRKCFFTLTAHMEKEIDEMTGVKRATVSTIGAKLAPKIPTFFSDYVLATKRANGFFWSTIDATIDLKHRALPMDANLKPDFAPIVAAYQRRKKLAGGSSSTPSTPNVAPAAPPVVPQAAPMGPKVTN